MDVFHPWEQKHNSNRKMDECILSKSEINALQYSDAAVWAALCADNEIITSVKSLLLLGWEFARELYQQVSKLWTSFTVAYL